MFGFVKRRLASLLKTPGTHYLPLPSLEETKADIARQWRMRSPSVPEGRTAPVSELLDDPPPSAYTEGLLDPPKTISRETARKSAMESGEAALPPGAASPVSEMLDDIPTSAFRSRGLFHPATPSTTITGGVTARSDPYVDNSSHAAIVSHDAGCHDGGVCH